VLKQRKTYCFSRRTGRLTAQGLGRCYVRIKHGLFVPGNVLRGMVPTHRADNPKTIGDRTPPFLPI